MERRDALRLLAATAVAPRFFDWDADELVTGLRDCITRSYFSSLNVALPAARKTGRLTLRSDSVVESLLWDSKRRRVRGVRVIDATTMQPVEYSARIVFMRASTLESARIMLNSTSADWPNGIANASGELGCNLMDHTMGGRASGTMAGREDCAPYGNRPNGIYIRASAT